MPESGLTVASSTVNAEIEESAPFDMPKIKVPDSSKPQRLKHHRFWCSRGDKEKTSKAIAQAIDKNEVHVIFKILFPSVSQANTKFK